MREIKYRVWDKQDKEWIHDKEMVYIDEDGEVHIIEEKTWAYQSYMDRKKITDDVEVVFFTGLKDKNGKEVYEGDSFTAKHRSGHEYKGYIQKGLSFEFVIKSYSEDFIDGEGIRKTDFTFDINSFVQYFPVGDFEIIGNVFENPSLLERT